MEQLSGIIRWILFRLELKKIVRMKLNFTSEPVTFDQYTWVFCSNFAQLCMTCVQHHILFYRIWWSWSLIHRFAGCLFYKSVNLDISICIIKKQFFLNLLYFDPLPKMTFLSMKICIRKKVNWENEGTRSQLEALCAVIIDWNTNNTITW